MVGGPVPHFQGSNRNQPSRAQYLVPGMSVPTERARAPRGASLPLGRDTEDWDS